MSQNKLKIQTIYFHTNDYFTFSFYHVSDYCPLTCLAFNTEISKAQS